MYIYNVTVKINPTIQKAWLVWMQEEHIPEVLATEMFTDARLSLLVEPVNADDDGITYVVQYFAESKSLYNAYIEKHAATLREKGYAKFGNQFIAFRSLLQIL